VSRFGGEGALIVTIIPCKSCIEKLRAFGEAHNEGKRD
jgi:hypothetical protein